MATDLDEPLVIDAETLSSKRKLRALLDQYRGSRIINLRMYSRLLSVYNDLKDEKDDKKD